MPRLQPLHPPQRWCRQCPDRMLAQQQKAEAKERAQKEKQNRKQKAKGRKDAKRVEREKSKAMQTELPRNRYVSDETEFWM